jgi:hypothetical protein
MRSGFLAALVGIGLLLAGCSGSETKASPSNTISAEPPAPTADTGTIAGLVTNEEGLPVAGVTVAIIESQNQTESDAGGAFVFNDLMPGTYKLVTDSVGFESAARAAEVKANEVTEVKFSLKSIMVAPEPFALTVPYTGMIQCSVTTGYAIYPCKGVTGQDKVAFDFFHDQNYTLAEMILELTWKPNSDVMGQELEFDLCKYAADRMETLCDGALGADGDDNYKYDSGGPPLTLRADKLDKKNNHWITGAGAAIGSPYPVYQQAFTIYTTICYYDVCADDYTALPPP